MTPEDKQKDLETRVKAFNEELIPLLGKYKVGLGAIPFIAPNGTLAARPNLFDDNKNLPEEPIEEKSELAES